MQTAGCPLWAKSGHWRFPMSAGLRPYWPSRTAEVENAWSAVSWILPSTKAPRTAIATAPMHAKMKALMTRLLYSYCLKRPMSFALATRRRRMKIA